jgi:hypothetical protein
LNAGSANSAQKRGLGEIRELRLALRRKSLALVEIYSMVADKVDVGCIAVDLERLKDIPGGSW